MKAILNLYTTSSETSAVSPRVKCGVFFCSRRVFMLNRRSSAVMVCPPRLSTSRQERRRESRRGDSGHF